MYTHTHTQHIDRLDTHKNERHDVDTINSISMFFYIMDLNMFHLLCLYVTLLKYKFLYMLLYVKEKMYEPQHWELHLNFHIFMYLSINKINKIMRIKGVINKQQNIHILDRKNKSTFLKSILPLVFLKCGIQLNCFVLG